jgi:hypothetical protein
LPPESTTRRLPVVGHLREAIKTQRALSPEQPGVIRLSCFEAEDVLAAIEAADEFLRRENYAVGEDADEALERLEERVSLLYEPRSDVV